MPRDGSGVYTLPAGNPVVTDTVISSVWANTTLSDIAAQLNNVLTRDGLLGPTGPFKIVDGTINAPGLAFNSEPGLGWYRPSAGSIFMAAAGQNIVAVGTSAAQTFISIGPRSLGDATIALVNAPGTGAAAQTLLMRSMADGLWIDAGVSGGATPLPFTIRSTGAVLTLQGKDSVVIRNMTNNGATLVLDRNGVSSEAAIFGQVNGSMRWYMVLGTANAASDFSIVRGNDAGALVDVPFTISRATGRTSVRDLTVAQIDASGTISVQGNVNTGSPNGFNGTYFNILSSTTSLQKNALYFAGGPSFNRIVYEEATGSIGIQTQAGIYWHRNGPEFSTPILGGASRVVCGEGSGLMMEYGGSNHFLHMNSSQSAFFQLTTGDANLYYKVFDFAVFTCQASTKEFWVGSDSPRKPNSGPWGGISDARIKHAIEDYTGGLEQVLALRPRKFGFLAATQYADAGKTYIGLVAQECEEPMPECVTVRHEKVGDIELDDMRTLDSGPVTWALVNAVKTLHERITQLENQ